MDQNKYHNADNFDGLLAGTLQKHTEPLRPGFTDKILKQIDTLEQQKLLAKIIMQERIALAGCVMLAISFVSTLIFFGKDFVGILTKALQTAQNTAVPSPDWEMILVISVTIVSVIYAFSDSLDIKQRLASKFR